MTDKIIKLLNERVVIFDGAMGTAIQKLNLSPDDFGGYDGCNEVLNLYKPDAIYDIYSAYYKAGSDVVETNTFGANQLVLAEYNISHLAYEINKKAAEIAKASAIEHSTQTRQRFVAGSVGPGTKLPSLLQVTLDELEISYTEQIRGLIDGGADMILIETCQDLLQIKSALLAVQNIFSEKNCVFPVAVQVTVELTGTMLIGTEIAAALTALEAYDFINIIGMNCASGPKEMTEHLRYLSRTCSRFLSVQPNAGIPSLVNGKTHYPLTPAAFAEYQEKFVTELGFNIVGGCCGTEPAHIEALAKRIEGKSPAKRKPEYVPSISSLYQSQAIEQDTSFFIIGERTNSNGSKLFRDHLLSENWDGMLEVASAQVNEGAHALDVCIDYVGRNAVDDLGKFTALLNTNIPLPIFLDSDTADGNVYEAGLRRLGGKCVINSIHLEDGGKKIEKVLPLCKRYGAGVVCLTIDENGQPHDTEGKVAIVKRLYKIATENFNIKPGDMFFDTLTFPLGTGQEEYRKDGMATIEAIKRLKAEMPGVHTLLGVSNISFGLKPLARVVLNSVFLHYALQAGLDCAIVHAGKIKPLNQIDPELRELARQIVFDERSEGFDPLMEFMNRFDNQTAEIEPEQETLDINTRLRNHIIKGLKTNLEASLDEALTQYTPLDIINNHLLDGMKTVGELFGAGEMQLPFVLLSAEVMKRAVSYLEPKMDRADTANKGVMVIATVAGDVHDIGKNLVDIILSNNGYKVINIGIKQHIHAILEAAETHKADVIGMSGLLVKSALIMRENLEVMNERGLDNIPVILGGAALTKSYVEDELQKLYKGKVYYAGDAFDGLRLMGQLTDRSGNIEITENEPLTIAVPSHRIPSSEPVNNEGLLVDNYRPVEIPKPPFLGHKTIENINLEDLIPFINKIALFRGQWQFKRGNMKNAEFNEFLSANVEPIFQKWIARAKEEQIFEPKVTYGFFPAQSQGNKLLIYEDDLKTIREQFDFPRQIKGKQLCVSDFFAPVESGNMDTVAFHCVTVGSKVSEMERKLFADGEFQDYLFLHGLGVETAESLAEYWHREIRRQLDIAGEDSEEIRLLFSCKYHGCRYSFGYPACPNLEDQVKLFNLLKPEAIGVEITENYQLVPEQTTTAIICHHPDAKYFNVY